MNNLPTSFSELRNALIKIRDKGFVRCTRENNKDGGIGNTLEDLLEVKENNLQMADFLDYEVKSQRTYTNSAITLFSMASEKRGNRELFNTYSQVSEHDQVRRLYWTLHMNKIATLYNYFSCYLKFDNEQEPQKLILVVKDNRTGEVNENTYWEISKIYNKIKPKMKNLVLCYADVNIHQNYREFAYKHFECYFQFSFSKFLNCLRNGIIQVDFRIGADLEGKNAGKYHDHGTGFRINGSNMYQLYEYVEKF